MIKKSLLGLFVSFVGLISFSFGAGIVWETSTSNFGIGETELYYQPYQSEFQVLIDGNFKTNDIYNGLQFWGESWQIKSTIFWYQGDIAFIHGNKLVLNEGRCYNSTPNINPTICGDYSSDINSMVSINQNHVFSGFGVFAVGGQNSRQWYSSDRFYFCFYNDHSFCVKSGIPNNASDNVSNLCSDNNNGCNISNFESILIGSSPFISSEGGGNVDIGDGGIPLNSDQSAINYFESRYGRNENICYVGIDNVTDLWGSSVSFEAGTGLNIFQLYSGLYGNSELNRVYVWLNSWLINYEQWFGRNGDPLFLSNYNSGTNQVDLYYDNLIFPFSNKPVALYFMASNVEGYAEYRSQGSEVVSYCNIKINGGTFDQIIDQSNKNNINSYTEQINKSKGLNPDGTIKVQVDFSQFGQYTGDAWITSGQEVAFSGDTSIRNVLKDFFDFGSNLIDYTGSSEQTRSNTRTTTNPILPNFIIWSLLFVLLFKFLKRR